MADTRDFPDEILLDIAHYIGTCSSHELRSLALVSRRWYLVAAPRLLATIRVCSLGDLVKLCDHLASAHVAQNFLLGHPISNDHNYVSMIEHHTRSIVVSGQRWPPGIGVVADYYTGLDKYQPPSGNGPLTAPDIEIKYRDMLSKLGASLPYLKQLDSLEWYGRFPGDYYLVNYLLQTRALSRLTVCVDNGRVRIPSSHCNIALAFKRLRHFTLETATGEYSAALVQSTTSLLHRSPGLERLVISSVHHELFSKSIVNSSIANGTPFIWPNLRYLELRHVEDFFWEKSENVELFAAFLSAHRQLETLIMSPWSHSYGGMQQFRTFSLASYADPLPNLRCLHGPLPILSGILENPRACPFLTTLVDSLNRRVEQSALDNLLQLMEHASLTSLRRLRVCVPQIQTGIFQRLSKASPGVQVLEIQNYGSESGDISTEDTQISHMLIETITLGLNQFPQLHTIGGNITQIYHEACAKITESPVTPLSFSKHLLKLLEAVPKIRFVHIGNGALFVVDRKPDQALKLTGFECMDNSDHDWSSSRLWKTRPISQEQEESRRKAEYMDVYEELLEGVEPAESQ